MVPLTIVSLGLCGYAVLRPGGVVAEAYHSFRARIAFRQRLNRNWRALLRSAVVVRRSTGPVLVEFGDYECPYCRAEQVTLDSLLTIHKTVTLLFEQFPLPMHPYARLAASASLCAARAGDGVQMHRYLLRTTDWQKEGFRWEVVAKSAGISNVPLFVRCLRSDNTKAMLDISLRLGDSLGVNATPTFLSRRGLHRGMATEKELAELVGVQ